MPDELLIPYASPVELAEAAPKTAIGKIRKPDLRDHYAPTEESPA